MSTREGINRYKMKKYKIPASEKQNFLRSINVHNLQRSLVVLMAMGILQLVQILFYLFFADRETYDTGLIYIKTVIVAVILVFIIILKRVKFTSQFFNKNSVALVGLLILVVLLLSIINTFKAQSITSDISIYILTLFLIVATIRVQPLVIGIVQGVGYAIFALGMPRFQSNADYLISHLMNGVIINVLAFIISGMFYQYSVREFIDKLEIENKNAELILLSQRDGLTGLFNHITIHKLLDEAINRASKDEQLLYLALLDLDYFKEINDIHGHKYGDEVLTQVSLKIKAITNARVSAGRYGGDEFMIFFEQQDEVKVLGVLKDLLKQVSDIYIKEQELTYSCGVSKWNGESVDQLIEKADKYLYKVKMSGRNNVMISQ